MSRGTLFDKVWDAHTVRVLPDGRTQLFIGLHLVHEITSLPAFKMLEDRGLPVPFPHRTFATVDHIIPTEASGRQQPFADTMADRMVTLLGRYTTKHGIPFAGIGDARQGIVHVIGPELGLTQPGMTIACGDSHTATHGALGAIAMGIGTTQVAGVLASQCLLTQRPKIRRINVTGTLAQGVSAKDMILAIIRTYGIDGGIGYAYEYAGEAVEALNMEGRMTLCNMSIEGGAVFGYVNPDQKTIDYLRGRPYAPPAGEFEARSQAWLALRSEPDAVFDDDVTLDGNAIVPMVTWGTNPGQSIGINETIPDDAHAGALAFMGLEAGQSMKGVPVSVVFIGSCTNSRISDLREAAGLISRHTLSVSPGVRALVVPGSERVRLQAEREGLDQIFLSAGFEWRQPGCSMCLGMNPDKLVGDELCISTSNRNFKGRQGSPTGRTVLASPALAVVSAAAGEITDPRSFFAS